MWRRIILVARLLLVVRVSLLLRVLVHEIRLLSGDWIVDRVQARLSSHHWSNYWLHVVLDLLLVHAHVGSDGRGRELLLHVLAHLAQIQTLKLLSSGLNIDELLLKTLLLLCKVHVGGNQLSIQVRVHLILASFVDMNLGRSEDLLRQRIHLTVVVSSLSREARSSRRLWTAICGSSILLVVRIHAVLKTGTVLKLGRRSGGRECAASSRLWSRSQARKQVRPAGSRSRSTITL